MFKKYKFIKWISVFLVSVITIIVCFGLWFKNLLPPPRDNKIKSILIKELPYVSENIVPVRGKILAVVTSTNKIGNSGKKTGYELSELARAYYTFKANGFEVDIASPKGGKAPKIIDDEDMGAYDFAFLNDSIANYKINHTIPINNIIEEDYEAIFFAGGKGAMFDFPNNKSIQRITKHYYQTNKVIGAVCHGPSALVNVILDNGKPLLENKKVSGFTNKEELLLISDVKLIFPFLLQDKMNSQGANFNEGSMYLDKVSHDQNLITGQNPWSTWSLSESMIKQLGYKPKYREKTSEENAVKVLSVYKEQGKQEAKKVIEQIVLKDKMDVDRMLIAKHAVIAAMKWDVSHFFNIINLVSYAKKSEQKRNLI